MTVGGHWVHDLSPFAIRFTEGLGLRWYGLAYTAGFAAGWWLLIRYRRAGRSPLGPGPEAEGDLFFALLMGVLLGGRLGFFLLYQPLEFLANPLLFFQVWKGGMASHGGFLGVLAAILWTARRHRVSWLSLGDMVVTLAPPGILFGRLANFVNGELWGRISDVPWAVVFPQSAAYGTPVHLIPPRHPSQLYEAFAEGFVLLVFSQWRWWRTDVARRAPGRLAGEFLVAYAVARISCEVFREPDASLLFGVSRGIFYSILTACAGLALIIGSRRRALPRPPPPAR